MAGEVPAEFEEEVEVVRAIYGDEAVRVLDGASPFGLLVDLRPCVEGGAALVSVTLKIVLPNGYPSAALPAVAVERSRGLNDAGLRAVDAAAKRAMDEFGLQEDGCLSQVLQEVSEALGVANDTCECCICLSACEPSEPSVHAPCEHVFHSACIGHWASLKDGEAEAAAAERSAGSLAQRDALRREAAEAVVKVADAAERVLMVSEDTAKRTGRVEALREHMRAANGTSNEAAAEADPSSWADSDDEVEGFDSAASEAYPQYLERIVRKAQVAKDALKRVQADEKRINARADDCRRELQALEAELESEAASRAGAPLQCPVCRAPVERRLFEGAPPLSCAPSSSSTASLAGLPAEVAAKVRRLQREHTTILERRRAREAQEEALAAQLQDHAGGQATDDAGATTGSGVHRRGAEDFARGGAGGAKASGKSRGRGGYADFPQEHRAGGGAEAEAVGGVRGRKGGRGDGGRSGKGGYASKEQHDTSGADWWSEGWSGGGGGGGGWNGGQWSGGDGWWSAGGSRGAAADSWGGDGGASGHGGGGGGAGGGQRRTGRWGRS